MLEIEILEVMHLQLMTKCSQFVFRSMRLRIKKCWRKSGQQESDQSALWAICVGKDSDSGTLAFKE